MNSPFLRDIMLDRLLTLPDLELTLHDGDPELLGVLRV